MGTDKSFLLRAIEIAADGIIIGGGPFGALVLKEGKVVSEAINRVVLNNDPTAHAEILAIREAAVILKTHDLSNCVLFSSCEPCPMCFGAIYWSGIKKVVYACNRIDADKAGFSDKLIYNEILLHPAERKIQFLQYDIDAGREVFRKWEKLENKIPY